MNDTNTTLRHYVKAGYSGLYITNHEELRVEETVASVAEELGYALYAWSLTDGLASTENHQHVEETQDPLAMLGAFDKLPEKTIVLARDFHPFLGNGEHSPANPLLVRKLKESLRLGAATSRVFIVSGCLLRLPPELEKHVTVIEFSLPDRATLRKVLDGILASSKTLLKPDALDAVLDSARGMTTTQAEDAFALSIAETGGVAPEIVAREKTQAVRKSGLLEVVESSATLDDIGGLENFKAHIALNRRLFTKAARDYGLPQPRPILVVGQPGTGKSLSATAMGTVLGVPLIRVDAGTLFGSLVGQTEANWRTVFATLKACAPCVAWMDEVDGAFAGSKSSGQTDGGTGARLCKAMLQDIPRETGIAWFFTANDVDCLPDPLIDRLDVWSVDLPNKTERVAIWMIQIAKERGSATRKRTAKKLGVDVGRIADLSEGFSGRQIEQAVIDALRLAFNDGDREPTHDDFAAVICQMTPTSKLMAEAIEARRKRLANRARAASAPEGGTGAKPTGRKIAK